MIKRVAYGSFTIGQTLDRGIRVKNACSDRQIFEDEVFAGGNDARCTIPIDVDYGFVGLSSELKCHNVLLPIANLRTSDSTTENRQSAIGNWQSFKVQNRPIVMKCCLS